MPELARQERSELERLKEGRAAVLRMDLDALVSVRPGGRREVDIGVIMMRQATQNDGLHHACYGSDKRKTVPPVIASQHVLVPPDSVIPYESPLVA